MAIQVLARADSRSIFKMPLFLERVCAGFPSPAQDYIEGTLDLNDLCIDNPAATYFVRVKGDSMIDEGIFEDDILIVDRSLEAKHEDIVIAGFHGELTVKQLCLKPKARLIPKNKRYQPIDIPSDAQLEIFGVVAGVLRKFKGSR